MTLDTAQALELLNLPPEANATAMRGGCWYSVPYNLRSAHRSRTSVGNRLNGLGFRLVQDK